MNMIREFKVDAVIGQRLLFCDGWQYEHLMLAQGFRGNGIPHLTLDREYRLGPLAS